MCAYLVLADITGLCVELVARLEQVLEVLFRVRFHTHEHLRIPQRRAVSGSESTRSGIEHIITTPCTGVCQQIVVEMSVSMVEHIPSVEPEIEVAGRVGMLEVQTECRITERAQSPLRLMMGIDIEDGTLAVIEVVAEIKEAVGVSQRCAQVAVVGRTGVKARGLGEQRADIGARSNLRSIVGILDRHRFQGRLYHRRLGRDLARCLNHRLEIPFDRHTQMQGRVVLRHQRGERQEAKGESNRDDVIT